MIRYLSFAFKIVNGLSLFFQHHFLQIGSKLKELDITIVSPISHRGVQLDTSTGDIHEVILHVILCGKIKLQFVQVTKIASVFNHFSTINAIEHFEGHIEAIPRKYCEVHETIFEIRTFSHDKNKGITISQGVTN